MQNLDLDFQQTYTYCRVFLEVVTEHNSNDKTIRSSSWVRPFPRHAINGRGGGGSRHPGRTVDDWDRTVYVVFVVRYKYMKI